MPLNEYRAKRDFRKTGEPSGAGDNGSHKRPIFVVQEHHASHLHYDFRLEADGVLKSWAVPKEPTLDPSVKRLAVEVEDHPLGYATFSGTIPEGQYGGGEVLIWDHGTYESLSAGGDTARAIEAGRLEFALHGEKLKGQFALIRMKARGKGKPQWLLIKMKDEFAEASGDEQPPRPKAKAPAKPAVEPAPRRRASGKEEVELTHPDKVFFPEAGLTKADVFSYYKAVADRLLPYLKDRPVTLERLPEGLTEGAPRFWQKDTPDYYPDWIPRIAMETERGKTVDYALVNDASTLLYLVNQGAVTFHVWASRVGSLDRPDFVLFDLDPGEATFGDAIAVALGVRDALKAQGVESFVKTSGKSGLHVLTPWAGEGGFDEARAWASEVAGRVAEGMTDRATLDIRKAKRGGRVYIDVMQNARGHHAVPPYVIRTVPRATVSTPLDWREVTDELDPGAFTPEAVIARLARRKTDPMPTMLGAPAGQRRMKAPRPG